MLKSTEAKFDELLLSFEQDTGRHEEELANVRAKLEANESELEALRLRHADTEKGLTKSNQRHHVAPRISIHGTCSSATGSVNRDEDQVTRRLLERVRALEAQMVSKRWNEKGIEDMECSNEKSIEKMEYSNEG